MSKELAGIGKQLGNVSFPAVLEAIRTGFSHPYAAWIEADIPANIKQTVAGYLLGPLHQGKVADIETALVPAALSDALQSCNFVKRLPDGGLAPSKWQLTSYKGIYAARDVPQGDTDSSVYVGEDSLHFVDWVSSANPCQTALDFGAGSGISSVAISKVAMRVDAVEIDSVSCEAIGITAALNGKSDRINTIQADLTEGFSSLQRYDLIVGNTPGVPIPENVNYSPAGNGGSDGLRISGAALTRAEELLATNGQIYLKFESIGDDSGPFSEKIVRELVKRRGWSAQFIQHSRIPMEIRSAISTRWAAPLNPAESDLSLLRKFDLHAAAINATYFYTCSVVISAESTFGFLALPIYKYGDWTLNSKLSKIGSDKLSISRTYNSKLGILPDGMWELNIEKYLQLPVERLDALSKEFDKKASIKEAVLTVFGEEINSDPVHGRCLFSLTTLLADSF